MIARLLRLVAGSSAAIAVTWFVLQAAAGRWWLGALGALVLLNLQPLVLAFEFFVLLPRLNSAEGLPRASWPQLARAWWLESVTAHDVFGWQQPFRPQRHADTLDRAVRGQRVVILVHGFFCNRGVWNRCLAQLDDDGIAYMAVTLEPPFAPLDRLTNPLDAAINQARRITGLAPVLVCHSMGGLVARAWWRAHAANAADRVHRVITIATPHRGAFAARFARSANARQMRPGCDWLRDLDAEASSDGRHARFTCFYSHCDNIVLPASSGALSGADNRHLAGWPHVAMIHAPQVWQEVRACTVAP